MGTSLVLPCTSGHTEFQMTFRDCSRGTNDDYSIVCTVTRSDCSFLCIITRQIARLVKQGNSSQRSCRPNAPHIQVFMLHSQLGISFRGTFHRCSFRWPDAPGEEPTSSVGNRAPCNFKNPSGTFKELCQLFSRLHFLSRRESKGRNLVLRPLAGFICQLEVHLLVHTLSLPLHVQRHGVSSSSMGTTFAAPSKFPRSTSRTSHPSRLSPEVVLHVEHSR